MLSISTGESAREVLIVGDQGGICQVVFLVQLPGLEVRRPWRALHNHGVVVGEDVELSDEFSDLNRMFNVIFRDTMRGRCSIKTTSQTLQKIKLDRKVRAWVERGAKVPPLKRYGKL